MFPGEEEVLIKPPAKFNITQNLKVRSQIDEKMKSYGGHGSPAVFIEGVKITSGKNANKISHKPRKSI